MRLEFFKVPLFIFKICLSRLTEQAGGGGLCSFLEIEMIDRVCRDKCPDYRYPWVRFSLKMQF